MGESFNPQYYGQQRVSLSEVAQESFAEFYATYTGPRTEDPSVSYLFRKVTKYTIGLPFYALLFVIDQLGQRLSESYKEKHDFFVKITKEDSVRQSIKDGIQVIRSAANNVLKTGTTSALDTSRSALISTLKSASHREILLACQKGYFEEANLKLNPDEKDESVAKKGDALLREQVKKAAEEGLAHIAKHYAEKNVESLARYSLDQKECNRLFGELNSKELGLERLILLHTNAVDKRVIEPNYDAYQELNQKFLPYKEAYDKKINEIEQSVEKKTMSKEEAQKAKVAAFQVTYDAQIRLEREAKIIAIENFNKQFINATAWWNEQIRIARAKGSTEVEAISKLYTEWRGCIESELAREQGQLAQQQTQTLPIEKAEPEQKSSWWQRAKNQFSYAS